MTKKVVTPDNESANLVVKLQKEVAGLKQKVFSMKNDVLQAKNKYLKLEEKYLVACKELKNLKTPTDFSPVDLSKFRGDREKPIAEIYADAVIAADEMSKKPKRKK